VFKVIAKLATALLVSAAGWAQAATFEYRFDIEVDPITTVTGYFRFTDAGFVAPPPGFLSEYRASDILTGLNVDWQGTHYDLSNTGSYQVRFASDGTPHDMVFGMICTAITCPTDVPNSWFLAADFAANNGVFYNFDSLGDVIKLAMTLTAAPYVDGGTAVPEPSSAALAFVALGALVSRRWAVTHKSVI
jgi:hypothetical protein